MTDILIYGINGRMGREVYSLAGELSDVNVACGVDKHVFGNFNCPVYPEINQACMHVDAIIDFSSPSSLSDILAFATEYGCAAVLASTGYTNPQLKQIEDAAERIPIWMSANASVGINALLKLLPSLKDELPSFDTGINEIHRRKKKDAPSGTALMLSSALGGCEVTSLRGGDVRGEHRIYFLGEHEMITLTHTVFSRRAFAEGAISACKKLCGLPAGLYR